MLLGLIPFGKTVNNAKRWYGIGDSMTIQPSEFSKILMIICLAVLLTKVKEKLNTWKNLLLVAVFCAVPLYIIYKQPDLSTTMDLFLILLAMIFVADRYRDPDPDSAQQSLFLVYPATGSKSVNGISARAYFGVPLSTGI